MASSSVRLRGEGIRATTDRLIFSYFGHFLSSGSDNDYNFEIGAGSLVTEGSVTISGDLTVNSPGVLKELGVGSENNVVQTVRINDTSTSGSIPFRAAASGNIYALSTVYWQAEADDTDVMYVWLSDGAGLLSENEVTIGPTVGGITAGETDFAIIIGGPVNPNEEALRRVSRGDIRWITHLGVGLTAGNDCTVVIEIDPAIES